MRSAISNTPSISNYTDSDCTVVLTEIVHVCKTKN